MYYGYYYSRIILVTTTLGSLWLLLHWVQSSFYSTKLIWDARLEGLLWFLLHLAYYGFLFIKFIIIAQALGLSHHFIMDHDCYCIRLLL